MWRTRGRGELQRRFHALDKGEPVESDFDPPFAPPRDGVAGRLVQDAQPGDGEGGNIRR